MKKSIFNEVAMELVEMYKESNDYYQNPKTDEVIIALTLEKEVIGIFPQELYSARLDKEILNEKLIWLKWVNGSWIDETPQYLLDKWFLKFSESDLPDNWKDNLKVKLGSIVRISSAANDWK